MLYTYFNDINFSQPWFFALFGLMPLLIFYYVKKNNANTASIPVSSTLANGLSSFKTSIRHLPFVCRLLALSCIIVCLTKPQTTYEVQQVDGEGINIMLCIDVSGSMTAQDFQPNRLEAAKNVASDFVRTRQSDKIGIVIFAGESFTQCPLTTDTKVLLAALQNVHNGLLEDGTAIGSGLSTSVDRLRTSKGKSKIVVLLTDGENNGGLIGPDAAKEIAKVFGVKVYTIGVGTEGYAPQPVNTPLGVQLQNVKVTIDEKLLSQIANETGGKYFRAKDNESLIQIYDEINTLEKSTIELTTVTKYSEKYFSILLLGLFFLLVEFLLRFTLLKKFP